MFEYVPRRVGGETGRFVEWVWFARGRIAGVRERIAPTGSTVAAIVLGDPIRQTPVGESTALVADEGFLIGPHDRPIVNEPQCETFCVGIVTTRRLSARFDQAHLIRDFKRHTGVTPAHYLAAQRSTYDRADAAVSPGFVPEAR